jgi:hypothetical protein
MNERKPRQRNCREKSKKTNVILKTRKNCNMKIKMKEKKTQRRKFKRKRLKKHMHGDKLLVILGASSSV